jgi:hypothetical protein
MRTPLSAAITASLGALCLTAGCSSRTDMSLTGGAPAQYSHVWVTVQAVWFNTSDTAGPDDAGWAKFPLSTPTTIDLVADNGGTLGALATSLRVLPGSYSQVRLIPLDPSSQPPAASAQAAGASFNAEVDIENSDGTTQRLPLELLNPDKGIGIATALRVPVGNLGGGLAAGSSTTGTFGGTTGANDATQTNGLLDASGGTNQSTTTGTTTTSSTSSTTTTASFAVTVNGTSDLVPFNFGGSTAVNGSPGIMLSQHAAAYDLSEVGGIQGTLTLTGLTGIAGASGLPDIMASAEVLSADGSRHVVVSNTPVHSDGTFLIYPLPTNSSSPTIYDVVIHGGGIATIIIHNVTVTLASSSSTAATTTPAAQTTTGTTTATTPTTTTPATDTSTTTTTPTTTDSSIITPTVNAVSIGTLLPRAAATYTANITTGAGTPLPAGSLVGFYQTPSGQVPYVIESSPLDPFNQILANAQLLSSGTIDTGTFVASGDTITLVSAAPEETAGRYRVAAGAPGFVDGAFVLVGPRAGITTPVTVTVPALSIASGGATGSVLAAVTPATAGKYDQGQLIVAHEGTVVGTASLNGVLGAGGGNVIAPVPAGTPAALYYVSVRVWASRNPAGTLQRQWYSTAVDLRSSTSGSIQLTIN